MTDRIYTFDDHREALLLKMYIGIESIFRRFFDTYDSDTVREYVPKVFREIN